jgi:hypothetical protein
MSVFGMYLQLGFEHIMNFRAYDHILFIITLCAVYQISELKHVIVLVTAFTIGHSATLVLATLNIIHINSKLVEFLIPLTIFITAIANISLKKTDYSVGLHRFKYLTSMFFGLIHGLGFSNYLRSLLGNEESIIKPLFAFNLGLEMGQLIVVSGILLLSFILINLGKMHKREWTLVLSGAGLGVSLILMFERSGFL